MWIIVGEVSSLSASGQTVTLNRLRRGPPATGPIYCHVPIWCYVTTRFNAIFQSGPYLANGFCDCGFIMYVGWPRLLYFLLTSRRIEELSPMPRSYLFTSCLLD
jgi:hypothetical protein